MKQNELKKPVGTFDMEPSWTDLLDVLLNMKDNCKKKEDRETAMQELRKMARAATAYRELQKFHVIAKIMLARNPGGQRLLNLEGDTERIDIPIDEQTYTALKSIFNFASPEEYKGTVTYKRPAKD